MAETSKLKEILKENKTDITKISSQKKPGKTAIKETLKKNNTTHISTKIPAPTFIDLESVTSSIISRSYSSKLKQSDYCRFAHYVEDIISMPDTIKSSSVDDNISVEDDEIFLLIDGYIHNIAKTIDDNLIIPLEISKLCYKFHAYHGTYCHDIFVDELIQFHSRQPFSSIFIKSLPIKNGHNVYYIKHKREIKDLQSKTLRIYLNQITEANIKHLVLSFIHDFDDMIIDLNLNRLQNNNENGSIIINAQRMNIQPMSIKYVPSINIFIRCHNFNAINNINPIEKSNDYKQFTGNFMIECNDIMYPDGWSYHLLFGSIYIHCNRINLQTIPYFAAFHSNVIVKCRQDIKVSNFQIISFGFIYIQCQNFLLLDKSSCFVTIDDKHAKHVRQYGFKEPTKKTDKKASKLLKFIKKSFPMDVKNKGTMANYEKDAKFIECFSYDTELCIIDAVLFDGINSRYHMNSNNFIFFNVDNDIKSLGIGGKFKTLSDGIIIKCNEFRVEMPHCYTYNGFRHFSINKCSLVK